MKKALLFLGWSWAGMLYSQQPMRLTIDDAIKMALEKNYTYRISQEQVDQYKRKVLQSLPFLPQISVDGYKNLKEKLQTIEMPPEFTGGVPMKVTLDFTKNYEFQFRLIQPVFTGGKLLYTFQNAQLDLKLAKEKERSSRDETVLNVKKMFYNILVLKELLQAQHETLALLEKNHSDVKLRFDQGMASQYDLLRAELALSSMKPEVLRVENLVQMAMLGLKTQILIPKEQEVEIVGELGYKIYPFQLPDLVQQSLVNRSEIKQLQLEKRKTANLLKLSYAQFVPDFSIVAQYSYRSDYFKFTTGNWENYYTINLGISFPIFTGLRRTGQVGELKVVNRMLDLSIRQLDDATRLEVENKYLTIRQELENIQAGMINIETAKEGVRIAELSYKEGMITILELNSSYNELTRAKVNYLQALYNYNIALAELEKMSGGFSQAATAAASAGS